MVKAKVDSTKVAQMSRAMTVGGGDMKWATVTIDDHTSAVIVFGLTQKEADDRANRIVEGLAMLAAWTEENKPRDVSFVRKLKSGRSLGILFQLHTASESQGLWYVYDRENDTAPWAMHYGPCDSAHEARQWIANVVETRVK